MARSAASARSSMLMAWIIRGPAQQIFTFTTHHVHGGRPSSQVREATGARYRSQRGGRAMTRRTFQKLTAVALTGLAATAGGPLSGPAGPRGPRGAPRRRAGGLEEVGAAPRRDGAHPPGGGAPAR